MLLEQHRPQFGELVGAVLQRPQDRLAVWDREREYGDLGVIRVRESVGGRFQAADVAELPKRRPARQVATGDSVRRRRLERHRGRATNRETLGQ